MRQLKNETMKIKRTYCLLTFLIVFILSCDGQNKNETKIKTESNSISADSLQTQNARLEEAFNEEDLPVNEFLTERLKPIQENFKRINSITNWTLIDTIELWETTEGGEAKFYYQNEQLEKVVTRHYGEMGQSLTEYYLLDEELSFAFEKSYKYNRPFTWNETAMNENNDTETFDFEKSEIEENRSYFENGEIIHKIESGDCGAPFAKEYMIEEEKRVTNNFKKLIKHKAE